LHGIILIAFARIDKKQSSKARYRQNKKALLVTGLLILFLVYSQGPVR
jgi:hypothetical protein